MASPEQKCCTEPVEPGVHNRKRERGARNDRLRGGSGTHARKGQHLPEVDEWSTNGRRSDAAE